MYLAGRRRRITAAVKHVDGHTVLISCTEVSAALLPMQQHDIFGLGTLPCNWAHVNMKPAPCLQTVGVSLPSSHASTQKSTPSLFSKRLEAECKRLNNEKSPPLTSKRSLDSFCDLYPSSRAKLK